LETLVATTTCRAMTIVQPMQRNRISSNLQAAFADVLQQGNRELR